MTRQSLKAPSLYRQHGATLIVSLVILAVITLLGVASMRSSNQQLLMAASARDRAVAFQAAEAALSGVERRIMDNAYTLDSFMPTCQGDRCFNRACNNGLCFSGDLENAVTRDDCRLADPSDGNQVPQHWRDRSYWETVAEAEQTDNRVITVTAAGVAANGEVPAVDINVASMIEFMCFVPRDETSVDDSEAARNSGVPLYRITVAAPGPAGRANVMLQSNFKAAQ